MLGRHADNLFWMARYLERAENSARRIQATLHHTLTRKPDGDEEWAAIIQSTRMNTKFSDHYDSMVMPNAINFVLRDKTNEDSVISCSPKHARMLGPSAMRSHQKGGSHLTKAG